MGKWPPPVSIRERIAVIGLLPFIVYFGLVILLVLTMLGLSWVLGQRRANHATDTPFESGVVPVGSSQIQLSAEFYLIAIFFVIFDLETIFIFAWAVAFFELGWPGYFAILVFIAVLAVALIYEWRSGALEWGVKIRTGLSAAGSLEERGAQSAIDRGVSRRAGQNNEDAH